MRRFETAAKIRTSARGEQCTLRLGCCNHDPETTVYAHLRMFGWGGMGQKPPEPLGVFACSACHDVLDRRNGGAIEYRDVLRALGDTLIRLREKGVLICK